MIEYSLIGSLIVLASIGFFMQFGFNFNRILEDLSGDFLGHVKSAESAAASLASGAGLPVGGSGMNGESLVKDPTSINLSTQLATTGVNGTTMMLTGQLESLAQELYLSGKIDQNALNGLIGLANTGHKMAEIEALVEEAARNANGDSEAFFNTKITYNGQTYSARDLARQVGSDMVPADFYDSTDIFNAGARGEWSGPVLTQLVGQYQTALQSIDDPAVSAHVTELVKQIMYTAELMDNQTNLENFSDRNPFDPNALTEKMASEATNYQAAEICTAGSGSDSGTNCQAN